MLGAWGGCSRVSTGTLVLETSLFPCPSLQDACESLETPLDCEGDGCALAGLFHERQADCPSVCLSPLPPSNAKHGWMQPRGLLPAGPQTRG